MCVFFIVNLTESTITSPEALQTSIFEQVFCTLTVDTVMVALPKTATVAAQKVFAYIT